jgi:YidC/Oxa1 family membrane protein insertase
MNFFIKFFFIILYQPLLNILVALYIILPGNDLGVAVILLTILIKLALHPLSAKGLRSQKAISRIQPQVKEIQEKFKDNKAAQSQALLELYRQEKVSPTSGCLPLLLQLPIIIALYQLFLRGLTSESLQANLYSFVPNPGIINLSFLGLNLESKIFVGVVAFLAGVTQFWQMKMTMPSSSNNKQGSSNNKQAKSGDIASSMQKQMIYIFPVLSVVIIWQFGAVIGLYWLVSTLFSAIEHILIQRKMKSNG